MTRYLVHCSTAAGHLFPLIPGLLALQERGHDVRLRVGAALVDTARRAGLRAEPFDPRIDEIVVRDDAAGSGADQLRLALAGLMARGPFERADLTAAIDAVDPDVVLVDTNAYGAAVAAQASGRPWAITLPSLVALPGRGIPPYGLGLAPARGPLGWARDRALWPLVIRQYGRAMLPPLNALRAGAGLPALTNPLEHFLSADRLLVLAGDPLEYPRVDAPANVSFVGAQIWDPPAAVPDWLTEPGDPWVLVTMSTDYQGDERLAEVAVEALRDEPMRVLVTLADAHGRVDLPAAANVRTERFVPHGPVLARAAAVVCHGGMGIVHKALAAGVPIVAVPFGRDQPEVARRVVQAGAGISLSAKRLTPDGLRTALHAAMAGRAASAEASRRLRAFVEDQSAPTGGLDGAHAVPTGAFAGDTEGAGEFDPARGPAGLGGARFADAAQELAPPTAAADNSPVMITSR
ncbi:MULTISPECIES: nucleotide disphospho-sugar-binding domain-containing protein [Frankia]|uniref:N-glycosyltransferase n=1 Tax=Frankia alni (strain DSM 45986 / CECT 9034 / ACN14a) TaxID=326424 RepID=Q0RGF9_FRAAA|nr:MULTISPECIES: nucleotide disphospho-sugar-binding domain-containing protein [Frankia]CAJ63428.1 putative N-glycosyltransferase [Frankia alni ACN14a]